MEWKGNLALKYYVNIVQNFLKLQPEKHKNIMLTNIKLLQVVRLEPGIFCVYDVMRQVISSIKSRFSAFCKTINST